MSVHTNPTKLTCPVCRRTKRFELFTRTRNARGGYGKGTQFRFGFCRSCNTKVYNGGAIQTIARHRCPEYADYVRAFVRAEMQKKRDEQDPSYYASIVQAGRKAQIKAINLLRDLQGKECAYEGKDGFGECDYTWKYNSKEVCSTPEIDHVNHDGRYSAQRHPVTHAREILKMKDPLKKYSIMCHKHNLMKYRLESPQVESDNKLRGAMSAIARKANRDKQSQQVEHAA